MALCPEDAVVALVGTHAEQLGRHAEALGRHAERLDGHDREIHDVKQDQMSLREIMTGVRVTMAVQGTKIAVAAGLASIVVTVFMQWAFQRPPTSH